VDPKSPIILEELVSGPNLESFLQGRAGKALERRSAVVSSSLLPSTHKSMSLKYETRKSLRLKFMMNKYRSLKYVISKSMGHTYPIILLSRSSWRSWCRGPSSRAFCKAAPGRPSSAGPPQNRIYVYRYIYIYIYIYMYIYMYIIDLYAPRA